METTPVAATAPTKSQKTSTATKILAAAVLVLGLLLVRAISVHSGKEQVKQQKISAVSGRWFCRTTMTGNESDLFSLFGRKVAQVHEIRLGLDQDGTGDLQWLQNDKEVDRAEGEWAMKEDFLVIERSGGGFAAFRIASSGDNRLTLVNRGGTVLEFTRVY